MAAENSRQHMVWALGLMSGTSMDGIDAALIRTDGNRIAEFGPSFSMPYEPVMGARIRAVLGRTEPDEDIGALARDLTLEHAEAVASLLDRAGMKPADIAYIGFHGQTITHMPDRNFTWQIGDGALLAAETGISVVHDFRSADVAAGGEGAPLAPVYHQALAAKLEKPVMFVNIGGVSNVTFVGEGGALLAFDTGPGNALMDDLVQDRFQMECDIGGRIAAAGRVAPEILSRMLDNPFFGRRPPKSLDRYDFTADAVAGLSSEDALATLCAFTASAIARSVEHLGACPAQWLVCGGGRHNDTLMAMLRERIGEPVDAIEDIGLDGDMVEAQAFAFMAVRSARGLPISFPGTTNAPRPMTGGRLANS